MSIINSRGKPNSFHKLVLMLLIILGVLMFKFPLVLTNDSLPYRKTLQEC